MLRLARPDESQAAYLIKKTVLQPEMDAAGAWDEPEQWRRHEQRFAAQEYFFVEIDGEPVGILARGITAEQMRLNQLFLLPAAQGRGIGRDAIGQLLDEAHSLGLPVRLQVLKTNPRAFTFYLRLGFSEIGTTETHHAMERSCQRPWSTDDIPA